MLKKIVSFGMLSLGSVWASSSTSDSTANLAESSPSQHTWTIQGIETAGVTAADVRGKFLTSQDLKFKRREWWSPEARIPSAPYDLSDYHESYLPPKHLR